MASTTGSAERLQKASGGWRLEFQQLVYNTPTLLRPKRFSVQGEQAILQQLRELNGHEPLVRDTERMFRGAAPDGAYVLRDGRWFPELAPEKLPEPEKPAEAPVETTARGRNALDEVSKRLQSLEDSVRELQEQLQRAVQTISAAAASGARAASVSHAEHAPTIAAQSLPAAKPSAAAPPPRAASEPPLDPDIPRPIPIPIPSAPTRKSITLPAMSALTDLIRGLAGPEANLQTSERTDWSVQMTQLPAFVSVVQDKEGDEAGSMIFDLEGALRLAGALLMESEEVIESLLEEKVMSDEMLDAASEVCNTLTSALNKVSGNPHLRAGKMQPFTEARAAALSTASKRDDYRYNQGGRFSLVAC